MAKLETRLDLEDAAEGAGGVVRLGAVVVGEDGVEAAVAEEGAAELADFGGSLDPAGSFCVELAELLELAILVFGEELGAHGGGCVDGVVFGLGLFSGSPGGAVVAETAAVFGAFGGAIVKNKFAGGLVLGDDVGFAAGVFQFMQRAEFVGAGFELFFDGRPCESLVAVRVFFEAGFQGGEERFGLLGGEGFFGRHDGRNVSRKMEKGKWKLEKRRTDFGRGLVGRWGKSKPAP
jgi:hypothetical protein